jgi:type I restriction enzyme M protein
VEVESLEHFWENYPQLQGDAFINRDETYLDFAPVLTEKRDIADFVANHQSVTARHEQFMQTVED